MTNMINTVQVIDSNSNCERFKSKSKISAQADSAGMVSITFADGTFFAIYHRPISVILKAKEDDGKQD